MISLRTSYALLVLASALVTLAFASRDVMVLMGAVAALVLAGMIVGQARDAAKPQRTSHRGRRP